MAPKLASASKQQLQLVPVTWTQQVLYSPLTGGREALDFAFGKWWFIGEGDADSDEVVLENMDQSEFMVAGALDRVAYVGKKGIFFREDDKAKTCQSKLTTKIQIIGGGTAEDWRCVVHRLDPPSKGVLMLWEVNSLRQRLRQTLAPDSDRRWVNSQWKTWFADFVEWTGCSREAAAACWIVSEQCASWQRANPPKTAMMPLPMASTDITELPEYSTSTASTLWLFMRWANNLPSDDEKKAAVESMQRFLKAGVSVTFRLFLLKNLMQ